MISPKRKLSASALSSFLKSPKGFYWSYIARLEPLQPSVVTYDHDKICGILWAEFVDRFYNGVAEESNLKTTLDKWHEQTDGWVPDKPKDKLTKALESWGAQYYQTFNKDDGTRNGSELKLENDRFIAYLDGLSHEGIVHEVKSTSRSPNLSEQLNKVGRSIQVKLYCVMAKATGYTIEMAFKDPPHQIFRGPTVAVTSEQRNGWEQELNTLADSIYSLGDDPNNYVCHPDGCCLITKNVVSLCPFQILCEDGANDTNNIAFKQRERRK